MKEIKEYDKTITFFTLFKVLKHNLVSILCFTITFLLCSTIALTSFVPRKYRTTGQLTNKSNIITTVLSTLTDTFKSDIVLDNVIVKLNEENIKHNNGKAITKDEISSGISLPASNTSSFVTISFTNYDKSTIQTILNVTFDCVINYLKNEAKRSEFSELNISKEASTPVDISNTKQKIIVFTIIAFAVAYLLSFFVDIKYDLVYDANDVRDLNTNVLELNYIERKKGKNE